MSRRTQKNVGVIGLGIIGRRVAECLRRKRFQAFVWNRHPRAFPNFVGSPAEIAELCDFIQIFVSDDDALMQVIQQMKQSLGAHHVVMAHSTVSPGTMRAVAEIVQRRGGQLLDAPFTGSKIGAEKGELVYYIGGDEAAFRRAKPVLEASSKQIVEIGEIGQATTIKLATNMITAATVQVAAEALALVHSAGVPLEKFAEAMENNGSNSGTLQLKLPKMLSGDFEPHFSVKHMLKDVEIAARLARSYGLQLPTTEAARDGLVEQAEQGAGDEDYAAVVRSYFPEGTPGKPPPPKETAEAEGEEQEDLTSWAARAPTESRLPEEKVPEPRVEPQETREPEEKPRMSEAEPEVAARNGHAVEKPSADELKPRDANGAEEPPAARTAESEPPREDREEAERTREPEEIRAAEPARLEEETAAVEEKRGELPVAESEQPKEDTSAAVAVTAPKEEPREEARPAEEEEEPRRGFFSRLFSKAGDY
ncbi:MAG TPA: NAD(P)-binding domain-containing protein [Chthoniobacterales bacterium]|nr:NAD(P)-binding domain-containing protein [Chthoniobacterales bacterium]